MEVCKWCGSETRDGNRCYECARQWNPVETDVIEVKLKCRSFEERCEYWMNKSAALTARLEALEKRLPASMPFEIGEKCWHSNYDSCGTYCGKIIGVYIKDEHHSVSVEVGAANEDALDWFLAILRAQWPGDETNERTTDKECE